MGITGNDMNEQLTAPVGITHVWPRGKTSDKSATPFSDERASDVWDEIGDLTCDEDRKRKVVVLTHEGALHDVTAENILESLKRHGNFVNERVKFAEPGYFEREMFCSKTGSVEIEDGYIFANLDSWRHAHAIIGMYKSHRLDALVLWLPEKGSGETGHLKYLPLVRAECPDLPIYIFHWNSLGEKWGVQREGAGNWEDEFIPLADCQLEPQEVIVEDLLIKGNIHVVAGRFETYKTMALLEWSSAILDGRPVHDHFQVRHRYPILYLCADMSPEQLADYAKPFGLLKHDGDFRVKNPKSDIFHAVDSPAIQQAVNGRILILDTMLDYAQIEKAFESGEWIKFFAKLRELMTVHGCVAVIMTAHATKTGAKAKDIDPSEYLKDSATFGGKTDVGYGFRKVEGTSQILIERIKGRGFKKKLKFTITVNDDIGGSHLDRGSFPVCQKPGEVELEKQGRPIDPQRQLKIDYVRSLSGSMRKRTDLLNQQFKTNHTPTTVGKWLEEGEFDSEQGPNTGRVTTWKS